MKRSAQVFHCKRPLCEGGSEGRIRGRVMLASAKVRGMYVKGQQAPSPHPDLPMANQ